MGVAMPARGRAGGPRGPNRCYCCHAELELTLDTRQPQRDDHDEDCRCFALADRVMRYVRELQRADYVESRRGRLGGTFIIYTRPAPNVRELRRLAQERGQKLADALTFRFAVETGAADMLAQQVAAAADPGYEPVAPVASLAAADGSTTSRREVLQARLADVNKAGPADYRRMDTLFHLAIAELTGSNLLSTACAEARMQLNDLLNAIPMLKLNITHAATQHQAIANAILAGDAERARTAVAEHLAGTGSLLRGFLG